MGFNESTSAQIGHYIQRPDHDPGTDLPLAPIARLINSRRTSLGNQRSRVKARFPTTTAFVRHSKADQFVWIDALLQQAHCQRLRVRSI